MKKIIFYVLLSISLFCTSALAKVYTVKTSGGDYDDIIDCLNAISGGDVCEVYNGTYSGGTISNSGDDLDNYIKAVPASGQSVTISSGINFGTNDYIQIGEAGNGFTFTSASLSCSPGGSYITIAGNTFVNIGNPTDRMNCHDILFDGNSIYSNPASANKSDFFQGTSTHDIANVYNVVLRNNDLGPRTSDGSNHVDIYQSECWGADHGWLLLEGNTARDVTGSNQHFLVSHCTSGGSSKNIIIRYNKITNVSYYLIDNNESSGGGVHENYVVYNNTMYDNPGSSGYYWAYGANVDGTMLSANNLFFDSLATFNLTGVAGGAGNSLNGKCPNHLIYDPDGTVSLSGSGCLATSNGHVLNQDPDFSDADPSSSFDFSISENSPARDAGRHLTNASNSGSSSTALTVDDPIFFQDGWAGIDPDCIAIGTVSNTACIVRESINYSIGAMTLDTALTWSSGADIWLYKKSDGTVVLHGSAPDIGASESGSGPNPPRNLRIVRSF